MTTSAEQLAQLWALAGGDAKALSHADLPGDEPALPGIYHVGVQAQSAIAASALAAAEIHRARVMEKMQASSLAELVKMSLRLPS